MQRKRGFPNLYASEDHIPAMKSLNTWAKNREKSRNRQNVPETYQTGHFQAIELYSIRQIEKISTRKFLQKFSIF